MKICIYGAGAIGSLLGGELARAGQAVTLIGRGPHIAAVRANGLTVSVNGDVRRTRPAACTDPAEAGPQDLVIMTLKGHQVPEAAGRIAPLLGPDTPVVAVQNGIPWWYFHKAGGALDGRTLAAVDPARTAWTAIGPGRVLGGVINASSEVTAPGTVSHQGASRAFTIGEPDGALSPRLKAVAEAFAGNDIDAKATADIRRAIWVKLMSNIASAPLCVLTRTTLRQLYADDGCNAIASALMRELGAVAASVGIDLTRDIQARIDAPRSTSEHKTSMLQDFERGRPLELDPICGALAEIGRLTGTPTPWIDAVYALLRLLAETTGTCAPNPAFRLAVA